MAMHSSKATKRDREERTMAGHNEAQGKLSCDIVRLSRAETSQLMPTEEAQSRRGGRAKLAKATQCPQPLTALQNLDAPRLTQQSLLLLHQNANLA